MLVEFLKESDVATVLKNSNHISDASIPTQSPFLWFRAPTSKSTKKKSQASNKKLLTVNGLSFMTDNEVNSLLHSAQDVNEQILMLYKATCLNELEIRLRYFTARQVR